METEDKTKTLADSIFTALKGGADFATLAKNYAQNEESTWLDTRSFEGASLNTENSDLLNSLIRANVNEWNMMKLGQGYILTQVLAKKAYQEKYNIAVIKRPVEFSKETYNKAYNDFSQFVAQNTKKEDVVKNAEENGYRLLERADFSSAEHYVGGVHNTREIVKWIFDAKEGEVSPLFECGDNNHMMVVVLDRINKAGYRNINLVADMLRSEIVRDKKAEQIMAKYGDFAKLSGAEDALTDTIKHITFSAPVYVSKTRASEPVLSALASKTEVNQISPLVKGNAAVYAIQVLSRNNGTETFDEKTESTTVIIGSKK
jgi:peptidyl-prolyl cis-trans isomerase D